MYTVTITPKGRTVVATKFIPAGTIVLKEHPFLVVEDVYDAIYQLYTDEYLEEEKELFNHFVPHKLDKYVISYQDIMNDISTLPEYMQDAFKNMRETTLRLLVAKFYRNAFTYQSPPCALLQVGTLMNHSCDNNVDFYVDKQGYFVFTANRNIYPNDEICDSYLQTNTSRKKRGRDLLFQYGFTCECSKCKVSKD